LQPTCLLILRCERSEPRRTPGICAAPKYIASEVTKVEQKASAAPSPVAMWGGLPIPVLALTMCAFCIGTAEFVVMGLLPDIARDLAVSIPAAGQLVTAYALGVVVGAPVLAALTARVPRKRVLLMMVGVFIIGNLLAALSPNYALLMIARILAAFAHGTLFGVGAVVAAGMVPPNRQASAIGLMFLGLTLANILGVPLGTLVGQTFGWRATFGVITALGIVALLPVFFLVPEIAAKPSQGMRHELSVLRQSDVVLAIVTTILSSASVFTLFTYIVPLLQEVSGFTPSSITLILFMVGVGLTVGITLGGKFSDRGAMRAMIAMLAAMAVTMVALPLVIHSKVATLIVIFLWAMAAFGVVPGLQSRVVDKARQAPNLASTLNIGAFNLGNAGGAFLGGLVINQGFSLPTVPLAGAVVAAIALAAATLGALRDRS
jgi:DHA1 family inner membrane transport protein